MDLLVRPCNVDLRVRSHDIVEPSHLVFKVKILHERTKTLRYKGERRSPRYNIISLQWQDLLAKQVAELYFLPAVLILRMRKLP